MEDRLYVVAVRIQHEGCVIPGRVAPLAQARCSVVGAPRPQGGGVEGLDLGPALGCEGDMLTDRMRVEAIDPEDRVIHSVADSVSPFILGKLHDSPEVQSVQHGVVKGGGTSDVRDADTGVVDHRNLLLGQSPRTRSARRTRTADRAASGRRSAPMRLLLPMPPPPNTATCEAGIMPWFEPCSQVRGWPSCGRRTPLLPRLAPIIRCTVVGEVSWGRCTSWRSAMPPIQPSAWKGHTPNFGRREFSELRPQGVLSSSARRSSC